MPKHNSPADIERASMAIICRELEERGVTLPEDQATVLRRVIHTTADFDYADNLRFTSDAVALGVAALGRGADIITDTNMTRAGVSRPGLERLGAEVHCFMAETAIAEMARQHGVTRAAAAVEYAAERYPRAVYAVGNAPTALLKLADLMEAGYHPSMVIGVPVGFVNVVESKQRLLAVCEQYGVPAIVALGRKGGSTVAAAICNALIYIASEMLDPADRGWH